MRVVLPRLPAGAIGPVLGRAVARWDPSYYDAGTDSLPDLAGNGLHARLGSAVGADSNDPLRLQYSGEKYCYLPGSSGNYISTPDSAAVSITGDIDIRVRVALDDWTPATANYLVSKRTAASTAVSYGFSVESNGRPLMVYSLDGTNALTSQADAVVPFSNGQAGWLRVTRNATTGAVVMYTSNDGVIWSQLGSTLGSTPGALADTASILELGARYVGTGLLASGKFYTVEIRNGIDGTVVAKFDASTLTEPYASVVSSTEETWTLNRSSSGRKLAVVDRDLLLLGTDDYLEVANSPLLNFGAGQFTAVVATRSYGNPPSGYEDLISKTGANPAAGWVVYTGNSANSIRALIRDGTNAATATLNSQPINGSASVFALVRAGSNVIASRAGGSSAVQDASSVGITDGLGTLRIGRGGGSDGLYFNGEFVGAAIFREALSADDLRRLASEFGVAA